jgi:hypothetical protein
MVKEIAMDSAVDTPAEEAPTRGRRVRARLIVVVAAVAAAVLTWLLLVPVFSLDVRVPANYGSTTFVPLGIGPVIFMSLAAPLAGWALLALLEKVARRRAKLIWTIVAAVVFLISLPWMPEARAVDITGLALLHVAVGGVTILGLRRTS